MKDFDKKKERGAGIELDIMPLLKALLSRVWLMALVGVVCAGLAFAIAKLFITPTYRCSFTAYVNNQHAQTDKDTLSISDLNAAKQLTQTYAHILRSNTILMAAAESIDSDLTYKQLAAKTNVVVQDETEILTVYVTDSDPKYAYDLAVAISRTAPQYMSSIIEGSSMKIIDYPEPNPGRHSPSYLKFTLLGFLFGVLLVVIREIILYFTNDTITEETEIETQFDLPILGVIPDAIRAGDEKGYSKYNSGYQYREIEQEEGDGNE